MEDLNRESLSIATIYPEACVAAEDLHEMLGVKERIARPYIQETNLFEPSTIMGIADEIGRAGRLPDSINHVAANLLHHCATKAPEAVEPVKSQIDRFFEERRSTQMPREELLRKAKRSLPRALFREVAAVFD